MASEDKAKKAAQVVNARGKAKGKKDRSKQYIFWIGGTTVLLVAACIMLLISPERTAFQIPVNDQNIIAQVNRNSKAWKASASPFFEGWTVGDVKLLEGISVSTMGGAVEACPFTEEEELPESFDSRERWPQCFNNPIHSMGNCTASWAIAAASTLSNRFCIADPQTHGDLMLSPQQLLSCDSANRGCEGGDLDTVWRFVEMQGLVSEICFPYQGDSTVSCLAKCNSEEPLRAASHCIASGEDKIRREIMANGPVVAPIFLMDDFLVYSQGLYQEMPTAMPLSDKRRNRIIHAVKIVGWGNMDGKPYWIVENSWGEDWGENGYAKVVRGGDPENRKGIVVENYVLAVIPAHRKVPAGGADDEDDLEDADLTFDEEEADDSLDEE